MIAVPASLLESPHSVVLLRDGDCCVIHKTMRAAAFNQPRLLTAHGLTCVLNGELEIETSAGKVIKVQAGESVLLPKGSYFVSDVLPDDDPFEAHVGFLDDALLASLAKPKKSEQPLAPFLLPSNPVLDQFHRGLHAQYAQSGHDLHALTRTKLTELVQLHLAVSPELAEVLGALDASSPQAIKPFLERHFNKPLTVNDFAALTGRSIATFRRECHRRLGASPKEWLTRKRMEHAKRLLTEQSHTVYEAMVQSGYVNPAHFSFAFQQFHGQKPSDLLRRS